MRVASVTTMGADDERSGSPRPAAGLETTRRGFLKGVGGAAAASLGIPDESQARAIPPLKIEGAESTTTVCPFCGVGCGQRVYTKPDGKADASALLHTEGDSEHPISEGTLCSKGAAISQLTNNERRLRKVLYRAPGAKSFEERSWDWAYKEIAKRFKKTRDASFQTTSGGRRVNRTEAIACLGGAALDNEECYLLVKAMRTFGLTYIEHQARI